MRVLILGGSSEASGLAAALATDLRFEVILSLAGRTKRPKEQPVRTRVGGFGGVPGLGNFLRDEAVKLVVDATHPFASQMSRHAVEACREAGIALIAIERPPWTLAESDRWTCVGDMRAAVASIGDKARIVFCGIGRLAISELRAFPEHHYVIRLIDAPEEPIGLLHVTLVQARGPFKTSDDIRLFREHGVEIVLAKNSGGEATISKIEAARTLALPVIMVERPFIPPRPTVPTVDAALDWLDHHADSRVRGV